VAEGRMLKKVICESPRLAALKNDTHRLIYTWLIPHLDIEGRHSADPRIVKSHVAPILDHISHRIIASALRDMADNDLIILYSTNGKNYLELQRFKKHQHLRDDREKGSDIPPPTPGPLPDPSRSTDGVQPDNSRSTPTQVNLSEVKLREVNARARGDEPVDNPETQPPKKELSEETPTPQKPISKNTHGERWTETQRTELEELMHEIKNRYGEKYHQQCYVWLQTCYNRSNPNATLHCLRRLIQDRLAGKSIPAPGRWLNAALTGAKNGRGGENAKAEARASEAEHEERKAEETHDLTAGIGKWPE